jgi:integrase
MPKKLMTDVWIKKIKPQEKQTDFFDARQPGLSLRIGKTGKKSWAVIYRVQGQRNKKRLTLGKYPELSLADARLKARSVIVSADQGQDLARKKQERKAAPTLADLATEYLEKYAINKKSLREDRRIINKDLLPAWGHVKAAKVKRRDVLRLLDEIVDRGSLIMANRTLALIRKMYNWGISRDLVENNPCLQVKMPAKERQRDRVFSENEIRALWEAFGQLKTPVMEQHFRMRLITAQRGQEVLTMRWQDVDLDSGWWVIPAEYSKNNLPHRVPLSGLALDILSDMKKISGDNTWVFPSKVKRCEHLGCVQKAALTVREKSGVPDFRPHDLRRTAASLMTGMGISRLTVSKILNHVETGVTRVYDRYSYDTEKRIALDKWARRLEQILTGKKAKVVSIAV